MRLLFAFLLLFLLLLGSVGKKARRHRETARERGKRLRKEAADEKRKDLLDAAIEQHLMQDFNAKAKAARPQIEAQLITTFGGKSDFLWGTAIAAYQSEGAWKQDGRQPSIWDDFAHRRHSKVNNHESGDVADDFYHLYEKDLELMASYGFKAFRFSISWTRVFVENASGKRVANPKGVDFYKKVLSSLQAKGITAFVTMFHWDLPSGLSWLKSEVVDEFVRYADFLFDTFPEVRNWLTLNEPATFCHAGYGDGRHAPGLLNHALVCGHNALLAHASVIQLWRQKYKASRPGFQLSIVLNFDWSFPRSNSSADAEAVRILQMHRVAWLADPIYLTGDYPPEMKDHCPSFTDEEKLLLNGSYEGVFAFNTYSADYVFHTSGWPYFEVTDRRNGSRIGPRAESSWLRIVPDGIGELLKYIHERYRPPAIIITENGVDCPNESTLPLKDALADECRVNYYATYLRSVATAVDEFKIPLKGYFAWSFLDNFEWADGYSKRFGLTYVNYKTKVRYPKSSARWWKELLARFAAARDEGVLAAFEPFPGQLRPETRGFVSAACAACVLAGASLAVALPRRARTNFQLAAGEPSLL